MYSLEFTKQALKSAKKIDKSHLKTIRSKIELLKINPKKGKKLTGNSSHLYSLRIGEYRVIYTIDHNKLLVLVIDMGHRKEIYK